MPRNPLRRKKRGRFAAVSRRRLADGKPDGLAPREASAIGSWDPSGWLTLLPAGGVAADSAMTH
jgi:hypothetical protein